MINILLFNVTDKLTNKAIEIVNIFVKKSIFFIRILFIL